MNRAPAGMSEPDRAELIGWLSERRDNAKRLANGDLGWLEDADYFDRAIRALTRPAVVPEPAAPLGFNHELKCWPGPFEALQSGAKTAEFRRDDRGFEVGDILCLREWTPQRADYTGRELYRRITHILGPEFGVPGGFVMLSLAAPAMREPSNPGEDT